jgi:hypothetical protein
MSPWQGYYHEKFMQEWRIDKAKHNLRTVVGKPKLIEKSAA